MVGRGEIERADERRAEMGGIDGKKREKEMMSRRRERRRQIEKDRKWRSSTDIRELCFGSIWAVLVPVIGSFGGLDFYISRND
jgi:hypothetical protein